MLEEDDEQVVKKARVTPELGPTLEGQPPVPLEVEASKNHQFRAPFFYYKDFSHEQDPDQLTPLTPPGRVPNFPAKMHAILSRPDLAEVVAWMPHGRSWRVLKPREFESRIIPMYFEHSKFSSFIRQANGWGFRRITQGRDRNSYYHQLFLRGLPHLCKEMKRPGVAQKGTADAEHEPDFQKISEIHPVPVNAEDDSIMLQCTVEGGPKARMPIYSGAYLSADKIKAIHGENDSTTTYTPRDHDAMTSFHNTVSFSVNQIRMQPPTEQRSQQQSVHPIMFFPQGFIKANASPHTPGTQASGLGVGEQMAALNAANRLTFNAMPTAPAIAPTATSQYATGFAAATALSNSYIRNMMGQAAI